MDYHVLATELALPAYVGMTDAEIVAALNAVTRTRQRVTVEALQGLAYRVGASRALRVVILTPETPPELRALCEEVLSLVSSRLSEVDLDDATAHQMFAALGQYRVLSAEQLAAIDALADVTLPSRAAALGLGVVTEADIERSRTWPEIEALRQRLAAGYNAAAAMLDTASEPPSWDDLMLLIGSA